MAKSPYPNLLLLLLLRFPFSSSTIPLGSVLYASGSNQSWSSPNFTFSVSFLPSSSPNSFLAAVFFAGNIPIWSAGTVDSRGSLRLSSSGSLRLTNGSNATVWDSGTDGLGVVLATIEDSGNLRLLDNQSNPVWSSFDHPTDTIVQLQNFTAGKVLRSGNYSFQLERRGNLTLKWNNSTTYWSQGLNSSFSSNFSSPSLALQTNGVVLMFDSTLSGGTETIYSDDYGEGSNTFRFLKLDDDGNLRIYSSASRNSGPVSPHWSAVANQCLVYGYCGNFGICSYNDTTPVCLCPSRNFGLVDVNDRRKGCKRKVELNDCSGNATMLDLGNTRLVTDSSDPNSEVFFAGNSPCRSNCLVSTTCLASVSLSDGSGNCWQKQRGSFFTGYQSSSVPSTSYVKVCGPVLPNQPLVGTKGDGNNSKVYLWIVAVAVVGGLLGLAVVEQHEAILDKRLREDQTVDMEQVKRMVQTSFWCTQEQPLQRPTMGKVVQMIEGITAINKPPRPKTLNEVSFSGSSGSTSHASILVASGPTQSSSSSATRSFQTMGITSSSTKIGQGSLLVS
ncbi:hypothetical protein HID58_079952 [Brassica napus]|uniref:Bulb-type lectin domain-containing protein n=1 Tax=Brassica napus TaxID=3708 RepID=A0ABQ7Y3J6_BRANA|nr:hypothetical protein HID58_079952 [Brassica napus]